MDKDVEIMRRIFSADKFAVLSGIQIVEVDDNKAVLSVEIKPHNLNANNVVQGGMLFELADVAYAVIANFIHPMTVSQCGHITYLIPASGAVLTAVATETACYGKNSVGQVVIYDEQGRTVCVCDFNGFIKPMTKDEYTQKYLARASEGGVK